jgi:CheY-like chemotaxis protein
MVYGFIKQSGGHVAIASTPGEGTRVRLYLPRAAAEASLPSDSGSPEPLSLGSECILVVEDDEAVRRHVSLQLARLGYRILTAGGASEALELLEAHADVDLLFTDIIMPGELNGFRLAETARGLRPELPVLFTSGYSHDVLGDQGNTGEHVQLLQKPYSRQDLAAAVRRALGGADR